MFHILLGYAIGTQIGHALFLYHYPPKDITLTHPW